MAGAHGAECTVGLISDTHGTLRPEVEDVFDGVDLIVHAGDIGSSQILDVLRGTAPVVAVRGNMDRDIWAYDLPETDSAEACGVQLHVLHDVSRLAPGTLDPACRCVVHGHTHQCDAAMRGEVLFVNPGTAGRQTRTPSVALLRIRGAALSSADVEFVSLNRTGKHTP